MAIFKSGKVVIVLAGRYAGRKAVVVKTNDKGSAAKKFGHALVAGVDRYPRKVVRAMGKKKLEKRTKVKPFVKVFNYNHILPTRYSVDLDLKKVVDESSVTDGKRAETCKAVKKIFEDKYRTPAVKTDKKGLGTQYFFNKLAF